MDSGLIHIPYMRPERTSRQTFDWAVENAIEADQRGFTEMMVAEHATQRWECIPTPELVIAAAARETERIKFAPMAHLLPHHHPAGLAIQTGWLSQILQGRYFMGVGAGAYVNASYMHGIKDLSDLNLRVRESLEIMEKMWARKPFFHEGKYWSAGYPEEEHDEHDDDQHLLADYSPWGGKFDIAVTGLSRNSPSIQFAGERGYMPVSIYSGSSILKTHWETYEQAALANGQTPDRAKYHVSQTVFVADTDKEAKKLAMEGPIGYCFERYLWPIWERFGLLEGFVKDAGAEASDVNLEWICDNVWMVGSPATVIEKMNKVFEYTGGWGTLQVESHDYIDNPSPWFESLSLIANEVAPKITLPGQTTQAS
jgi:alkanesulfonate monooxygenase SsuD/methylene tetrahydromethanopterin reductase-like flavin-dependent oxidoreductase (luciferase family)